MTREYFGTLVAFIFLILGLLLCLTRTCQAGAAERALRLLCPGQLELELTIEREARRHLQHPALLVALMYVESRCEAPAVSRRGALGLLQIMPRGPATGDFTPVQLLDPVANIMAGARWLAMLEVWCGGLLPGLGAYNSGHCKKSRGFARWVHRIFRHTYPEKTKGRAEKPGP
jgi:soluble lytic murein transglycosylase-like protein